MLTIQSAEAIRRIETAIGYTFRDKRLLVQVFTRKTFMKIDPEAPDNEVLEFYGDTLMSYHVTTYFVEKFAHMLDDGLYFMRTVEQFTEMRSHYVRNQYLTERIKQLIPNIDRLVRAQNPRIELPKDNQKAYADLFESLIGAVYLDSYRDDKLIRAFILRHLNLDPKETSEVATRSRHVTVLPSVSLVDADDEEAAIEETVLLSESEDTLEENASANAVEDVVEEIVRDAVTESVETLTQTVTAVTEVVSQATAEDVRETVAESVEKIIAEPIPTAMSPVTTPVQSELEAFCRQAGYDCPGYGEPPKNAPNARPVAACTVCFRNGRGKPVKISLNDSGKTLAEATEKAAAKMLKKLREQKAAEEKEMATAATEPKADATKGTERKTAESKRQRPPRSAQPIVEPPVIAELPPAVSEHVPTDFQADVIAEATADVPISAEIESIVIVEPSTLVDILSDVAESTAVDESPADAIEIVPEPVVVEVASEPEAEAVAEAEPDSTVEAVAAEMIHSTPVSAAESVIDTQVVPAVDRTTEPLVEPITETAIVSAIDMPIEPAPKKPSRRRTTTKKATADVSNLTPTEEFPPATPAPSGKSRGRAKKAETNTAINDVPEQPTETAVEAAASEEPKKPRRRTPAKTKKETAAE